MHIQFNFNFQLAQQCIQISTRINSSSVHTYIFVCSTLRVILQGFVTQNATETVLAFENTVAIGFRFVDTDNMLLGWIDLSRSKLLGLAEFD